jgi:uncharacterized protein involved in outer membrane biogenesis
MNPRTRRRLLWPLGALALAAAGVAAGEASGWRCLAQPMERWLSQHLHRELRFGAGNGANDGDGFYLSLLGHVKLRVAALEIANPAWSQLGPMLQARQATLTLHYGDLLAARGGQPLTVAALQADGLKLQLERRADGAASWQFGDPAAPAQANARAGIDGVHVESLVVRDGGLTLRDATTDLQLAGQFGYLPGAWQEQPGWVADAHGRYRGWPVSLKLRTGPVLPEARALRLADVPLTLAGGAGQARLSFDGTVRDLLGERRLAGRYQVRGPSLAAVGEPMGVTLPTTPPFTMQGRIESVGERWTTHVESAEIGRSRLAGDFEFLRRAGAPPSLTGELRGPVLWLQDLGPAIGTRAPATLGNEAPPPARPASAPDDKRVLPDRPLDLPSLSAMQADVRIKLDRLELGHPRLQSMQPLRAHLKLAGGVLSIDELDATLARGRVWGRVQLDGRQRQALWNLDLSASDLRLEQWISQARPGGRPPYVAGELAARIALQGRGRSVAELLGTSSGSGRLVWSDGTLSHLVLEAAGIDLAQALGVMVRGDDALPVTCGAADLQVKNGQVEPRLLVVDTRDSTVWGTGSLSLADEHLDLVAHVAPKDVSPLALRTPLRVRGTLGDPSLSLEKGPLAKRVVPALLLGLVNPLAALLPLVDPGNDAAAQERLAGCHRVARQGATATPPAPKTPPRKPAA